MCRRTNGSRVFVCTLLLVLFCVRHEIAAQTSTNQRTPRVLVSAREVRVIFPKDTARAWGWPARGGRDFESRYSWAMIVESIEGNRWLYLDAGRGDSIARQFSSLAQLVAAGRAWICRPGMVLMCDVPASALVIRGQVHLVLRDRGTIRKLFGLRPRYVTAFEDRPIGARRGFDSVRVDYVAPQIPTPDSAFRADAALARRRAERAVRWRSRGLGLGGGGWNRSWVAVGDSMSLGFYDNDCVHDVCNREFDDGNLAAWSLSDSSVATLRVSLANPSFYPRNQIVFLVASKPGRTIVTAQPLRELSDSTRYAEPPPRTVEREVMVTLSIARVELSPRPDSANVGDTVAFAVRVIDRENNIVERAPVELSIVEDHWNVGVEGDRTPLVFRTAGRRTVIARLGAHSDSLIVLVKTAR